MAFEISDPGFAIKICENLIVRQYALISYLNSPFDCVARLYVLRHAAQCDDMIIRIVNCAFNDKLLTEITDILSNANGKLQVRFLSFVQTKFSDKGVADLFKKASAAFTTLEYLSLCHNTFIESDIIMSSFMHTSCTSLTQLFLSHNPLGVSGILSLETAVLSGALINLKSLGLSNTLTDDADVNGALLTTLLQSIASRCAELILLDFSDNNLGSPGLCSVVENIPLRLNHIALSETHLTTSFNSESQYLVTCEILDIHPNSLTSMDLTNSNFNGIAGTLLLAKILQTLQSLERLDCSDCYLTSADIIMLIHQLKSANVVCKNLNELDLSNNSIDDEGLIALTECLSIPHLFPSLKFIGLGCQNGVDLGGNPVSKELILMCNKQLEV